MKDFDNNNNNNKFSNGLYKTLTVLDSVKLNTVCLVFKPFVAGYYLREKRQVDTSFEKKSQHQRPG